MRSIRPRERDEATRRQEGEGYGCEGGLLLFVTLIHADYTREVAVFLRTRGIWTGDAGDVGGMGAGGTCVG